MSLPPENESSSKAPQVDVPRVRVPQLPPHPPPTKFDLLIERVGARLAAVLLAPVAAALVVAPLPVDVPVRIGLAVVGVVLAGFVVRTLRDAQRMELRTGEDGLPPGVRLVVFLRSFADDGSGTHEGGLLLRLAPPVTFEAEIAGPLRLVGPVVAIGIPGEELPEMGARRLYVEDVENWRAKVLELLGRAKAVVVRLGRTSGVGWELAAVGQHADPTRVALFFPAEGHDADMRERIYAGLRAFAERQLGHPLPETIGDGVFITFDRDWSPSVLVPSTDWSEKALHVFGDWPRHRVAALALAEHFGAKTAHLLEASRIRRLIFELPMSFLLVVVPAAVLLAVLLKACAG